MDARRAEQLAREHIAKTAELVLCDARPAGLYVIEGTDEYLFAVHRKGNYVGRSEIMAVNKVTGAVRSAGYVGE